MRYEHFLRIRSAGKRTAWQKEKRMITKEYEVKFKEGEGVTLLVRGKKNGNVEGV